MQTYATYFDTRYLARGAACLSSILRHSREAVALYVLALDDACAAALPGLLGPLPNGSSLHIETLSIFESRHPDLAAASKNRPRAEYVFTLTPPLCLDALQSAGEGEWCIYVDADTFFFSDPAQALAGLTDADVAITEHRFPRAIEPLAAIYGRFNVGWLAFRQSTAAIACLDEWARLCLESCSLTPDATTFGDQKYLDAWPSRFKSVAIVNHPGVNVAPWNASGHKFAATSKGLTVDGQPLVVFHFHRLARRDQGIYETDYRGYGAVSADVRNLIYPPYLAALEDTWSLCGETSSKMPERQKMDWSGRRIASRGRAALRLFSHHRVVFRNTRALSPLEGLLYV